MAAPSKWRSTSKKARKASRAASWTERLEGLRRLRGPYASCQRALVERALRLVRGSAPIVELGAGTGQLRRLLPEGAAARWIHSDPDGPSLERLKKDFAGAETRLGRAEHLLFEDASVSAVVGCACSTCWTSSNARFGSGTACSSPAARSFTCST
jgi:hypothetical protein